MMLERECRALGEFVALAFSPSGLVDMGLEMNCDPRAEMVVLVILGKSRGVILSSPYHRRNPSR